MKVKENNSKDTPQGQDSAKKDNFLKRFWNNKNLKAKLYKIIFESDTPQGRRFDIALMIMIASSILVLMIESVGVTRPFKVVFIVFEYIFTAFFTFEYLARLYCSPKPLKYVFSFYGIVDLLSTLPVYISIFFSGARYLLAIRAFRLIRIFRIFKLFNFLQEGQFLLLALRDSFRKIVVFFLFVLILVISIGTVMYMIEGAQEDSAFNNIFTSIYWAIVTMTTVGYGDITPTTPFGRFLSAFVMLLGYTIIAVPTGIVSATMTKNIKKQQQSDGSFAICPNCNTIEYDAESKFCKYCGCSLDDCWRHSHPKSKTTRTDNTQKPDSEEPTTE